MQVFTCLQHATKHQSTSVSVESIVHLAWRRQVKIRWRSINLFYRIDTVITEPIPACTCMQLILVSRPVSGFPPQPPLATGHHSAVQGFSARALSARKTTAPNPSVLLCLGHMAVSSLKRVAWCAGSRLLLMSETPKTFPLPALASYVVVGPVRCSCGPPPEPIAARSA